MTRNHRVVLAVGAAAAAVAATPALAQGAVADKWRWLTFLVFGLIIASTMLTNAS